MVNFKCEIKGLNKFEKDINKIIKKLPQTMQESVEDILKKHTRLCNKTGTWT